LISASAGRGVRTLGLTGIRDRVEALGGWLTVAKRVGGGTVVTGTFLLPAI
jgi:signal transduction histidine kinase